MHQGRMSRQHQDRMEFTPLWLMILCYFVFEHEAERLNIHPNKSQFFWYEPLTVNCVVSGNFSDWTLMRNTSKQMSQQCSPKWGVVHESSCKIENTYPSDSGVYWCESSSGELSNTININITDGAVILESPALPVTEGDNVTFLCYCREDIDRSPTNNFSAKFYKNGVFIGNADHITLSSVSKVAEGFYKCEHPTLGESPQSWLTVNTKAVKALPSPHSLSLAKVMGIVLLIVLFKLMMIVGVKLYRKRTEA